MVAKKNILYFVTAVFGMVLVAGMFGLLSVFSFPDSPEQDDGNVAELSYHGIVCVQKKEKTPNVFITHDLGCDHNLIYSNGLNITRNFLTLASGGSVLNISLCNAPAGAASTSDCASPVAAGS